MTRWVHVDEMSQQIKTPAFAPLLRDEGSFKETQ